jgi:hypothetical protein
MTLRHDKYTPSAQPNIGSTAKIADVTGAAQIPIFNVAVELASC